MSVSHNRAAAGMLTNITAAAEQAERAGDTPLQVSH
jgi:hypothetical protein